MDLKISKGLETKKRKVLVSQGKMFDAGYLAKNMRRSLLQPTVSGIDSRWNFLIVFVFFMFLFGVLIVELTSLQVVQGNEMLAMSENNQVRLRSVPAYRGVIFDRNGKILVSNQSSMNVYLTVENYLDKDGYIDVELLEEVSNTLGGILGGQWKKEYDGGAKEYSSISEKVYSVHKESPYFTEILIANDVDNDVAIKIKALSESLPGVYLDNGNKRSYVEGEIFSHILGYTGTVSYEDLDKLDYVSANDVIGRTGLERLYDRKLIGTHGQIAWEVDALGRTVSKEGYVVKEAEAGKNLYLTLDIDVQRKLYEILKEGVKEYKAVGGAGVIQDSKTGELIAMVSFPGYDNNMFVDGISVGEYSAILNDSRNPLLNRAIAAQMPPGSTFKTIVAVAGLDSGAISKNTIYVSRRGYTFSSGAPFQDYRNSSYGALNLIDAISVSSNIYFCELIRNWDMNKLVPYLEKFGIGEYTGVDVPGEAPGRLPSPANKVALANTTSPWLEPVWYPEGDSCNSVIGQGITLVTPLQMANWTSAIANGGTLNTPHVSEYFLNDENERETLEFDPIYTDIASKDSLKTVRDGMWSAVSGPRGTIRTLSGLKVSVAAKTGTAEFGRLNKDGMYENTHAWVTGFFPYENPKYTFTIFLEDGGESLNAVKLARQIIEWMAESELI